MSTTVVNQRNKHFNLLIPSLLLGLLTLFGCTSSPNAPSASSSQSSANDKSQATQWVGQWELADPGSGQKLTFILTPEGKLYALPPATSESSVAYEIPVRKVSDVATLPPNTKIVDIQKEFANQANKAQQSEGKQYIGSMNRAQQAYYLENNKFATTMDRLQIGIKPETDNYIYQIVPQSNQNQSVMLTAKAKKSELKSYTGAVFVTLINGENITIAGICETEQASSTPPAMPAPPNDSSRQIQCPAGSRLLQR